VHQLVGAKRRSRLGGTDAVFPGKNPSPPDKGFTLHFVLRLSVEGKGFPSILRPSGSKDTLKGIKGVLTKRKKRWRGRGISSPLMGEDKGEGEIVCQRVGKPSRLAD